MGVPQPALRHQTADEVIAWASITRRVPQKESSTRLSPRSIIVAVRSSQGILHDLV